MFLFSPAGSCLPTDVRGLGLEIWGKPHLVRLEEAALVWVDDGFTRCEFAPGKFSVRRSISAADHAAVEFEWSCDNRTAIIRRSWSGEFPVYHDSVPVPVASSHQKLYKLLTFRPGRAPIAVAPASEVRISRRGSAWHSQVDALPVLRSKIPPTFERAAKLVRDLVHEAVRLVPDDALLLLSGGIDSSAIAAAMRNVGRRPRAATFTVRGWTAESRTPLRDIDNARIVARHLDLRLDEVGIEAKRLVPNLSLAAYLCETHRGTIVDEAVALMELARHVGQRGFRHVCFCNAADDLFGAFPSALRFYRGRELQGFFQDNLRTSANEIAIVQNIFAPWRIAVHDPYWTQKLFQLGYHLPLRYRIDRARLMKPLLRAAFREDLPAEIVTRPKCVTRDATGVRAVMEQAFGRHRERYRQIFNRCVRTRDQVSANLLRRLWKMIPREGRLVMGKPHL